MTQAKTPHIKDVKLFWRNLTKENNIKSIKLNKQSEEIVFRSLTLQKTKKWDNFKMERVQIIDKYIQTKKN